MNNIQNKPAMRIVIILIASLSLSPVLKAQQDIFGKQEIISPEINEDKSVTFRLKAPAGKDVSVSGSWMDQTGSAEMKQNENGIYTYTTEALESDLYRYNFFVDSVRTVDPNNAHTIRDVANISNLFLIEGGIADHYKVNDVPHGTLAYRWYDSPANDKKRRMAIYTPPGYENSEKDYPILYLLHGIGGDEEAWISSGRLVEIMDNLIAQGKAEPMIVTMPNGNVFQEAAPGHSSKGFVQPGFDLPNTMDGKFESSFMEIMNFMETHYRVSQEKNKTAIAGLSMGGYHTAYISRNYPETFDYIGLFSPAMNVKPEEGSSPAYSDLDKKLKEQKEEGYELYWIAVGEKDFPVLYKGIQDYMKELDQIEMDYSYKETGGGHSWDNWRKYLVEFASMLFK